MVVSGTALSSLIAVHRPTKQTWPSHTFIQLTKTTVVSKFSSLVIKQRGKDLFQTLLMGRSQDSSVGAMSSLQLERSRSHGSRLGMGQRFSPKRPHWP